MYTQKSCLRGGLSGSVLFIGSATESDFGCGLVCVAVLSWSGLMFWSPGDMFFTETGSPGGFCWFAGRGTRCGPGVVPRTRIDTGFWPLWVTGTLLGPETCTTWTHHTCVKNRYMHWKISHCNNYTINNSGQELLLWQCTIYLLSKYRSDHEIQHWITLKCI